jgi:ribosomal protein S18 acetylase RimI-like enzyme
LENNVTLRRLNRNCTRQYVSLVCVLEKALGERHPNLYHEHDNLNYSSVVVLNEKVLGGMIWGISGKLSSIRFLGIDSNYQRKGYGSMLIRDFETLSRQNKVTSINLTTEKKTLHWYEGLGYIPERSVGKNGYLMVKSLIRE